MKRLSLLILFIFAFWIHSTKAAQVIINLEFTQDAINLCYHRTGLISMVAEDRETMCIKCGNGAAFRYEKRTREWMFVKSCKEGMYLKTEYTNF